MDAINPVPQEIEEVGASWRKYFHRWWFCHYLVGVVGTIAAITVASNPKFLNGMPYALDSLAWLSAVSVSLMTFL